MLTSKKPTSKSKKSLLTTPKPAPLKPKKNKPKPPPPTKLLTDHQQIFLNYSQSDQHKTSRIPTSVTCRNRDEFVNNPYFQLLESCQRTISISEYQLSKYKDRSKSREAEKDKEKQKEKTIEKEMGKEKHKGFLRKKEEEKDRDTTSRQINKISEPNPKKQPNTKQRSSKSVDNIKKIPRKIQCRSHSQSRSQSKGNTKKQTKRKNIKTESDFHKRKPSQTSEFSILKSKEETTLKKGPERLRSKSVKIVNPKSKRKEKEKESEKLRTLGEERCHNEISKIRALREIIQVQKNIRVYLQHSDLMRQEEDYSLVTVKDYGEEEVQESKQILDLIEDISNNIENKDLQKKVGRLSILAEKYFEKKENTFQESPHRISNNIGYSQFALYDKDPSNKSNPTHSQTHHQISQLPLPSLHQLQKSQDQIDQPLPFQQYKLPPSKPLSQHPHSFQTIISPRSYLNKIDEMLHEKSLMNHSKFQRRMELIYKLYENELYSPKTFHGKIEFIESVQVKEYEELDEQIESALRIKSLIESMKRDREEIAQLEMVCKEKRWEEAVGIIGVAVAGEEKGKGAGQSRVEGEQQQQHAGRYNSPVGEIQEPLQNIQKPHIPNPTPEQPHQNYRLQPTQQQPSVPNQLALSQISVIKQYCKNIFKIIKQSSPLLQTFLANLVIPINYDFQDLLHTYHKTIKSQSRSYNTYHYWHQSLDIDPVISQQIIETILQQISQNQNTSSPYYQHNILHQRLIIQSLNESLNHQRLNYLNIDIPWDSSPAPPAKYTKLAKSFYKNDNSFVEKVEDVFDSAVDRLLGWAKHYCGILVESLQGNHKRREGIPEEDLEGEEGILRQVRMALMLHSSLIEYDHVVTDVRMARTEVKLRLEEEVVRAMVEEFVMEMMRMSNK